MTDIPPPHPGDDPPSADHSQPGRFRQRGPGPYPGEYPGAGRYPDAGRYPGASGEVGPYSAVGLPGAMPTPPESANPVAGHRIPRPKVVETAFRVMLAAWGLAVIIEAVGLVGAGNRLPGIFAQAQRQQQARSGGRMVLDMTQLIPLIIGMTVAFAVVGFGLWLLFIIKARQGRNWARVWMLVCGIIVIVFAVLDVGIVAALGLRQPGYQIAVSAGQFVSDGLAVAALVLMYRPAARPYFHPDHRLG